MGVFIGQTGEVVAGLIGGAVTATAAAIVLDRGRVTGTLPLGTLARIGSVAVLAGAAELSAPQLAVVALAVSALSILDALRRRAGSELSDILFIHLRNKRKAAQAEGGA